MTEEQQPSPAPAAQTSPGAPEMRERLGRFGAVALEASAVLGDASLPIEQFLKLTRGSVIELRQHKDTMVTLQVNGLSVARGEVLVANGKVGVEVKQLLHIPPA